MANAGRRPITGLTPDEFGRELERMGQPGFRARQVWRWLYVKGAGDFGQMTDVPADLRRRLSERFSLPGAGPEVRVSSDGTRKFRFPLGDGAAIESVWIPDVRRHTLCISSQAGCPLKCAFCVTGWVGFRRNLGADEIVEQVRRVKAVEKLPVTNVVFMGMGEPLLNAENVIRAIAILTSADGLRIGKRRITVSTAGIVPRIKEFFERTDVKLAVSLTGASDRLRDAWMPINRKYGLARLMKVLRSLRLAKGRRLMFEVVLIRGMNDNDGEAERLAKMLKGIPAKVNLIPYNENPFFPGLKRPPAEAVERFRARLEKRRIPAIVRENRGEDISGACGQLAGRDVDLSQAKENVS